ncbi:MAG: GTP cyclohydrolase I FolE [Chloroflexi bacterium]|nr:GTP cyclohydrolase I FolE [Chloroflexota bacterium]
MELDRSEIKPSQNGHKTNGTNGHSVAEHAHVHDLAIPKADFMSAERLTEIEDHVYHILEQIGEDPERDGLLRTPRRVAKAYAELLEGYAQDVQTVLNGALFEVEYDEGEMVIVADIPYQSMCEHHMLPFTGKAHVAYIPRDRVVGLSKIPRIVDMFSKRLQVQERLTNEIAETLQEALDPLGVMIVMSGEHTCGSLRGVKKHGVHMITKAVRGAFREDSNLRAEFYELIKHSAK